MTWLLREELVSKKLGTDAWFKRVTPIGPCSTTDRAEAAEFPSERAAMQSTAYTHAWSFYEPVEVGGNGEEAPDAAH